MKNFKQGEEEEQKKEKYITRNNPQPIPEQIKSEINNEEANNLEISLNQKSSFEKKQNNNFNNKEKNSLSNEIYKSKSRPFEDNKETSNFTNPNKKLRNTMTGLNNDKMKYESGLIDIILKVEKDNVNHYLKGDLNEIYNDINRENYNFKNDIFLANVDNFEKKTGIFDKKPIIPYNCSEDISYKLDTYPRTNEIIEKFAQKSKTFSSYD